MMKRIKWVIYKVKYKIFWINLTQMPIKKFMENNFNIKNQNLVMFKLVQLYRIIIKIKER